jgi:hypothetical protein
LGQASVLKARSCHAFAGKNGWEKGSILSRIEKCAVIGQLKPENLATFDKGHLLTEDWTVQGIRLFFLSAARIDGTF